MGVALWMLCYPDAALADCDQAISVAQEIRSGYDTDARAALDVDCPYSLLEQRLTSSCSEQDGRTSWRMGATRIDIVPPPLMAMRAARGLAILQIYHGGPIATPELIGEQCLRAPPAP